MTIYQQKHALYNEYLRELEKIRGEKFHESEEEQWQWCESCINLEEYKWINLWDPDTKELCGFLIIGRDSVCHPQADYFVAQAFVHESSRGKGLMKNAIMEYEAGHPGLYVMIIIKNNENAYGFWRHVFNDCMKYRETTLDEIPGAIREDEEQIVFHPAKRR